MATENENNRKGLISIITTPIQLAALIVLVVEVLLGFLLNKANPKDIPLYVIMMVGILALTIAAVFIIEAKRLKAKEADMIPVVGTVEKTKKTYEWDVFLAVPMAALTNDEFEKSVSKVAELVTVLEQECNFKRIFYASKGMKTKADFDTADISVENDVNALKGSQYFIMVYPEKIVSSVLYEAGIALALGKPSFYFGKKENFPFLMQQANQKFNHVKIYEADTIDIITGIIKKNKSQLFNINKVEA